jgi:hypothetical protein
VRTFPLILLHYLITTSYQLVSILRSLYVSLRYWHYFPLQCILFIQVDVQESGDVTTDRQYRDSSVDIFGNVKAFIRRRSEQPDGGFISDVILNTLSTFLRNAGLELVG